MTSIETIGKSRDQVCPSRSFWDTENIADSISTSSLQRCCLSECLECDQFLELFKIAMGPEDLPSDLCFQKQKNHTDSRSILWDVVAQSKPRVRVIEVVPPTLSDPTPSHKNRYIGWTGNQPALDLAASWIDSCINDHANCGRYRPSPLPDRVLDVSRGRTRLYESRNEDARFISLSHCWGLTKAKCTTLKHNLAAQCADIAWSSMPKTFQDAIVITRALGVQYIWIDNVCIIQDDSEDWNRQAVQMASIYSRCYVTIAATASSSDEEGCFRTATNDASGHAISVYDATGSSQVVRVRAQVQPHWTAVPNEMMAEEDFGDLEDEKPPLFTRAWCFQERLLSSRYLRFDEWEMSWSCRETETCSCGYLDRVIGMARGTREQSHPYLLDHEHSKLNDAAKLWREAVYAYGNLSLTYEKDRLTAIAALAERHGDTLRKGDRYLAGLWRSSLIADMLWFTTDDDVGRRRGERSIPSWSWACRKQSGYMFHDTQALARVVEVHCDPVEGLEFAQVHEGAYVVLSSVVVKGHFVKDPASSQKLTWVCNDQLVTLLVNRGITWLIIDVPHLDVIGKEITLLCMAHVKNDKVEPGISPSAPASEYWIILRSVVAPEDAFERVGILVFQTRIEDNLEHVEKHLKLV